MTDDHQAFQTLLAARHTLRVLNLCLYPGTARFLASIPSSSVSLICIANPHGFGDAPMTYSDSWRWESLEKYERHCLIRRVEIQAEFTRLSTSIRKIAQRFSSCHPKSKTQVRATLTLWESEVRAVENGETPLYKAKLGKSRRSRADSDPLRWTLAQAHFARRTSYLSSRWSYRGVSGWCVRNAHLNSTM